MGTAVEPQADDQCRLLLIEDDERIRKALSALVSPLGDVTAVDCGDAGIELLRRSRFDVVVTDYEMERGNGLDVLRFVHEQRIGIPVIMITAFGTQELVVQSVEKHVFGFIEKPFDPQKVMAVISEAIQTRRQARLTGRFAEIGLCASQLTHEMRNPLMVATLRAELLKENLDTLPAEAARATADQIAQSIRKIRGLLEWTTRKMMSRGECLRLGSCRLEEIVSPAIEALEPRIRGTGVRVTLDLTSPEELLCDRERLVQAVTNLVSNALDAVATKANRHVRISGTSDSLWTRVSISDNGDGIPDDLRHRLFTEPFTTKETGSGIGLTVVRDIVRAHGGTVSYRREEDLTVFQICLPRVRP